MNNPDVTVFCACPECGEELTAKFYKYTSPETHVAITCSDCGRMFYVTCPLVLRVY